MKNNNSKQTPFKWRNPLIIALILLAIGLVFLLKNQTSTATPSESTSVAGTNTTEPTTSLAPGLAADALPEEQVDYYIEHGQAAFVFFHSTDCQSCIDMMAVVEEVFPEFQEVLRIVDVNVYDALNQNLLRRARINSIPTQLFLQGDGEGSIFIGVMSPDQLREQLRILAGSAQ